MKHFLTGLLLLLYQASFAQIQYGTWRTTTGNTDYHFLTRDGGGTAVYINQISTNASRAILRLSSGTATPNQNVRFTVENNGYVGIGRSDPWEKLHVESGTIRGDLKTTGKSLILTGTSSNLQVKHDGGNQVTVFNSGGGIDFRGILGESTFLSIRQSGKIGIGTTTPDSDALLTVKGVIHSTEIKVLANAGVPDYVFESDYDLRTLNETKNYIAENKHLPEIPSAKTMETDGIDLGEMNMLLLKKIEELTLHMIRIDEQLQDMKFENQKLKAQINN